MVRVKLRVIKLPIYLATVRKATWSNSCIICIRFTEINTLSVQYAAEIIER